MVRSDSMNKLKTQQELLSESWNIPWLMYFQIVRRIKSNLKNGGGKKCFFPGNLLSENYHPQLSMSMLPPLYSISLLMVGGNKKAC